MTQKKLHEFIKAIKRNDVNTITSLIESGIDVNSYNEQGLTPLCIAAAKGNKSILQLLLNAGAEINKPSKTGFTPLTWAAQASQNEAVRYLSEMGGKHEEINPWIKNFKRVYPELDID